MYKILPLTQRRDYLDLSFLYNWLQVKVDLDVFKYIDVVEYNIHTRLNVDGLIQLKVIQCIKNVKRFGNMLTTIFNVQKLNVQKIRYNLEETNDFLDKMNDIHVDDNTKFVVIDVDIYNSILYKEELRTYPSPLRKIYISRDIVYGIVNSF